MELKKAQHSSRRIQLSLSLGLVLGCAQFSSAVLADEFLCQATQASDKALPRLEQTCPIGKGVWGKKVPQGGSDFYWIQCGLLPKPMSLAKSKPLYNQITTDVWMKAEPNGYRCLIGPYKDPAKAAADLRGVKTLPSYREAFIRVVGKGGSSASKQTKTVTKPMVGTAPAAPAPNVRPNTDAFKPSTTTSQPKPVAAKHVNAKPIARALPENRVSNQDGIVVRLKTALQGKTYVVPYLIENHNQFYMEYGKPWNRLNYKSAAQICQQLGMSLAESDEFKTLRSSGVMEKNNWPLQLPYWGKGKKGLFTDREPNQLTGTSLLNVMCVK
ncbi:SPOR domain-containing protein [Vibrio sp. J1-1]|uniref:SPOR domain-containing protein n=1 Tax=Vibrio sp. J1-1 TaxID=2912251 RepID=UPI001F02073B|nr:SPOR domain-containing protein [Vibrio sp. J1-1]MCF7482229.1 SPOR domain-containing protein [Vibrio sp. J1-1]